MTARYQVLLKNQKGVPVALLTDESPAFRSFYCTHVRNAPGECRFEVDGDSDIARLFEVDGQIELLRRAPEFGINDWYVEWEGFHITERQETAEDGTTRFISNGATYLDLVRREEVGYFAGSAFTDKSGPGETVIKQFVYENVGMGAGSFQRVDNGVMAGLSVQADNGLGASWEGSRAWKPLLGVIQEIAEATGLVFDVAGIGPAQFEFRVYDRQRGKDRSLTGLNEATGLNGAGNAPVTFSKEAGNMITASMQITRGDEINVVYVLGQGEQSDRNVLVVKDTAAVAVSPWNRRVVSRNAVQETVDAGLQSVGESVLNERRIQTMVSFMPLQVASTVYGRHYGFGDRVSVKYANRTVNVEIAEVELTVNESGEDLRFRFR